MKGTLVIGLLSSTLLSMSSFAGEDLEKKLDEIYIGLSIRNKQTEPEYFQSCQNKASLTLYHANSSKQIQVREYKPVVRMNFVLYNILYETKFHRLLSSTKNYDLELVKDFNFIFGEPIFTPNKSTPHDKATDKKFDLFRASEFPEISEIHFPGTKKYFCSRTDFQSYKVIECSKTRNYSRNGERVIRAFYVFKKNRLLIKKLYNPSRELGEDVAVTGRFTDISVELIKEVKVEGEAFHLLRIANLYYVTSSREGSIEVHPIKSLCRYLSTPSRFYKRDFSEYTKQFDVLDVSMIKKHSN